MSEMNVSKDAHIRDFNYEANLNIFLYNLVRLRQDAQFTQQDMACLISTSQRNYQRLEKGEAEFSFSQILKISKILNCEVGDLYDFKKVEIQKFNELSESYVANELGLMEFVCFNDRFFNEYLKRSTGKKIFDYALTNALFINNTIPITIKDCDWEVYNNSCEKFVTKENVLMKRKRGFAFKDKLLLLNLHNKILKIEKPAFYSEHEVPIIINGVEQTLEMVLYVVHDTNNQIYISGTIKR